MKLAAFNGSPRGKNSNTSVLLHHFFRGFKSRGGEVASVDLLIRQKHLEEHVRHFKEAEAVMLAMPLYVDSVPGMVKEFIEATDGYNGAGKTIFFLIHSGFPEGIHSEGVSNYFQFLVRRWNMNCQGIIVLPGSEGIRMRHESGNRKLFRQFEFLGESVAETGTAAQTIIEKLKQPYKFPGVVVKLMAVLKKTGMFDGYWKKKLKEKGAWRNRFDAPYWQK